MKIDDILRKLDIAGELSSVAFRCSQLYDGLHSDAKGTLPALVSCYMFCTHAAQLRGVRGAFADIDNLVAHVKAATIKNKLRQAQFTHRQPSGAGCDKMGHMVEGRDHYADNLIEVKKIVNEFEGDGILVKRAKEAVNDAGIAASLLKIKRDTSQLPKIIQSRRNSPLLKRTLPFPVSFIHANSIRCILASHFRSQLQSRQCGHCPIR